MPIEDRLEEAEIESILMERNSGVPEITITEENHAWEAFHDNVFEDCVTHDLSDMDAMMAWKMGLEVYLAGRKWGSMFPHDPSKETDETSQRK